MLEFSRSESCVFAPLAACVMAIAMPAAGADAHAAGSEGDAVMVADCPCDAPAETLAAPMRPTPAAAVTAVTEAPVREPWVTEHVNGASSFGWSSYGGLSYGAASFGLMNSGARRPPLAMPAGPGGCNCAPYQEITSGARPFVSGGGSYYRSTPGVRLQLW